MELSPSPCMYAIVCSQATKELWPRAHRELTIKYESKWSGRVRAVTYPSDSDLLSSLPTLAELKPTYTCFLAHHSECDKTYVQNVHKLTRELDPTTHYTDTIWGILTGLDEEDCLYTVKQEPLVIRRVVGNCPLPLEKFNSGVWFSESEQSVAWRKLPTGPTYQETCPPDVTEDLLREIGARRCTSDSLEEGVDMIVTSGHATENELNLAYCFDGGQFRCCDSHLYGFPLHGDKQKLTCVNRNPKILSAAGNCLMGHIPRENCMALAWLHSACVTQMVGYVVPTWYGYGGWGVHKYFINNPGNMSFAQAYFANLQSLIHKLDDLQAPAPSVECHEQVYRTNFGVKSSVPSSSELLGLSYDQDTTVLYGDPAWQAQLTPKPDLWDFTLQVLKGDPFTIVTASGEEWSHWLLRIKTLRSGQWDCPIGDDKTTSPGRPPVYVFPSRVSNAKFEKGHRAVVTCNFVLVVLSGSFVAGETFELHYSTHVSS